MTGAISGVPDLGQLAINLIGRLDLPTVMGPVFMASAFVMVENLLVDIACAAADPRLLLT